MVKETERERDIFMGAPRVERFGEMSFLFSVFPRVFQISFSRCPDRRSEKEIFENLSTAYKFSRTNESFRTSVNLISSKRVFFYSTNKFSSIFSVCKNEFSE